MSGPVFGWSAAANHLILWWLLGIWSTLNGILRGYPGYQQLFEVWAHHLLDLRQLSARDQEINLSAFEAVAAILVKCEDLIAFSERLTSPLQLV